MQTLKFIQQHSNVDVANSPDLVEELNNYTRYLEKISQSEGYVNTEDFFFLPDKKSTINDFQNKLDRFKELEYDFIVVAGIGGANLGFWTVADALSPAKEILYAETIDPYQLKNVLTRISNLYENKKRGILIGSSNSGKTTETIANFSILIDTFKNHEIEWKQRIITITKPKSPLESFSKSNDFSVILVPNMMVGRCSIFSLVALVPLHLAGIDTDKFLSGAAEVNQHIFSNSEINDPLSSAISVFNNAKSGMNIYNSFLFSTKLEKFGHWFRQLVGESLGKDGAGITPINSIGTTDLHSMAQLYFAGPRDKFTCFISLDNFSVDQQLPDHLNLNTMVPDLNGKSTSQLMRIIEDAVKQTYQDLKLPYTEISLSGLSPESVGALLQFKLYEVVYLARLLKVNPFNQPEVELYKEKTRQLMKTE